MWTCTTGRVFGFAPGEEVDLTKQTVPVMRLWAWLYRVTRNLAQNVRKARGLGGA